MKKCNNFKPFKCSASKIQNSKNPPIYSKKTTVSNFISFPHRKQWKSPDSTRETHWLTSEIYCSTVEFTDQPVSFPSDNS